jgi:hypothetical protein
MRVKKLLSICVIVFAMFIVTGCELTDSFSEKHDFRNFNWGDPDYLIKKEETAQIRYDGDSRLMFWSSYMGYDCDVTYIFSDRGLKQGYIRISSEEDKETTYVTLAQKLTEEYGEPYVKNKISMKFNGDNNTSIYMSKDGESVTLMFSEKKK